MKMRTMAWIGVIAIVGLASFWIGGLIPSREAYALQILSLQSDRSLLADLRAGDTTNAIHKLEVMLDVGVLRAMHYSPLLRVEDRTVLDKRLASVADYREKYPRQPVSYTNTLDSSKKSQHLEKQWTKNRAQIDAFLHRFAKP
jgi:hypothetical protein